MSTPAQYDAVVSAYNSIYDDLENLPCGKIEEANMHAALKDHILNKRVLDLACGSGHYSQLFLQWGAKAVTGVDISSGMLAEAKARAAAKNIPAKKLSFVQANVSEELDLSDYGAPFDVVTGTWLLNYASSQKEMEGMFRAIRRNCHPGSVFFGLTIPPPLGSAQELDRALAQEWAEFGTTGHVLREVEDGFEVHTALGMPGNDAKVEFDNFYLRHEAFEESAKAAGLGALEWLPVFVTEELREEFGRGYWNKVVLNPHFRICRVVC